MNMPSKTQIVMLILIVLPGVLVTVVSGYFVLRDWAALIGTFQTFEHAVASRADLRAIEIANDYQITYRINCFADGVGVLLGMIITSIGIVGICVSKRT